MTPNGRPAELAYYTVTDAAFFPGAVALLNSVRLAGDASPFVVVDCGLTDHQRRRLAPHATLVPMQRGLHPQLQKATGPLAHPAEIMVVVDADILITRSLEGLVVEAAAGGVVAFDDKYYPDRSFEEWTALGLGAPRAQRYVNSGLLVFSAAFAREFLPPFVELQQRLDMSRAQVGGADDSSPFYFPDQDILNAMLSTRFDGRVARMSHALAPVPPFAGIKPIDGRTLRCAYADGAEPYALHHILKKPWLASIEANLYSELFTRAVTASDAPIHLGTRELPLRLTDSRLAAADRWRVALKYGFERRFRGKLGVRPALERRLQRLRHRDGGAPTRI
jgi:hypothetical protein